MHHQWKSARIHVPSSFGPRATTPLLVAIAAVSAFLFFLPCAYVWSQEKPQDVRKEPVPYPPHYDDARELVYKRVGDSELKLFVFSPSEKSEQPRAAIVFFFGGGWQRGGVGQFVRQCRYLASRGMVAIAADYRVASRQGAKPVDCVRDAKSAMRYVRAHAAELAIDPDKIAAGGGSAGGHLAACIATIDDFDDKQDDRRVSPVPNALVLFNPVVALAPLPDFELTGIAKDLRQAKVGAPPQALSPVHHIRSGGPPTIIFHGEADSIAPFATVEAFARRWKQAGNRCELVGYPGQEHSFFNYKGDNRMYFLDTLTKTDEFLASLKYLQGPPQVEQFFKTKEAGQEATGSSED